VITVTVNTERGPVDVRVPDDTYDMGPEDYIREHMWNEYGMERCDLCGDTTFCTTGTCPTCREADPDPDDRGFAIVDDGTLDTVVRCDHCGGEVRYSWDGEGTYDEHVAYALDDAAEQHVCGAGEI